MPSSYRPLFILTAWLACPIAASAQVLKLQEFAWPRDDVVCGLSRAETISDKEPDRSYLFVTAYLDDPQLAIERGYVRLGTDPEELDFVDLAEARGGEIRRYRTQAAPKVEIRIDIKPEKAGKETVYAGTLTARRGSEEVEVAVKGSCR